MAVGTSSSEESSPAGTIDDRAAIPIGTRRVVANTRVDRGLPTPRTPLIGRDLDVARVVAAFIDDSSRLATITGPGGVGKTRVSIEVAHQMDTLLRDGAVFVPLAGVADAGEIAEAIAGALHIAGSAVARRDRALQSGLRGRAMLLVLDNFEQLMAGVELVTDLVDACDELRILVTSRGPLRVDGEVVLPLGPLPVPDSPPPPMTAEPVSQLAEIAAVQLFVQRGAAVRPGFALSSENADSIAAACQELNGLPLAIELAAARLTVMTPDSLVRQLGVDPLAVLARGGRDLPPRQRSLRATIAWSHELLSDRDRVLLRRLSTFESGFDLDGAQAVGCMDIDDTLDGLSALVDVHLVEPAPPLDHEPRFALPVAIRDFAREQLAEAGELDPTRSALVAYFIEFADEAGRGLESPDERTWLDRIEGDMDQIRVVLAHLRVTDPEAALRLTAALGPFWLHRGLLGEGRRHLESAVEPEAPATDPSLVAMAAAWEARLAADQGVVGDHRDAGAMIEHLEQGLAAAGDAGDVDAQLRCLDFVSHVLGLHDDDITRAVNATNDGIAIARAEERTWWLAQFVQRAAVYARLQDEGAAAAALATEAMALARTLDADRLVLHAGLTVAQLPPIDGVEHPPDLQSLLELATAVGDKRVTITVELSIAIEHMLAGEVTEAVDDLRAALSLARDTGYWHGLGFALMTCAGMAALSAEHETCARLHGAALTAMPVLRRGMPPAYFAIYEQLVEGERAALGAEAFDERVADAARLGWDHATAIAFSLLERQSRAISVATPVPRASSTAAFGLAALTTREREVLALVAAGNTNKDIARLLAVSPKTVMHHSVSIYRKLGARGRAEATAVAYREGLLAAD